MERLQNLSGINTNTIEGRLLIAAMAKISSESQTNKTPDEILEQVHDLAEHIYKELGDFPSSLPPEPETFEEKLSSLINKHSMENTSNTPDYLLAKYLIMCFDAYSLTVKQRDTWFKLDPWNKKDS